jgi:hypothetical protein
MELEQELFRVTTVAWNALCNMLRGTRRWARISRGWLHGETSTKAGNVYVWYSFVHRMIMMIWLRLPVRPILRQNNRELCTMPPGRTCYYFSFRSSEFRLVCCSLFKPSGCTGIVYPWVRSPYFAMFARSSRIVVGFDRRCGWFEVANGESLQTRYAYLSFFVLLYVWMSNDDKDKSDQYLVEHKYRSSLFRAPCRSTFSIITFSFAHIFLSFGAACCKSSTHGNTFRAALTFLGWI